MFPLTPIVNVRNKNVKNLSAQMINLNYYSGAFNAFSASKNKIENKFIFREIKVLINQISIYFINFCAHIFSLCANFKTSVRL